MVQTMVDDDAELISLHYGLDVDAGDAQALLEQLEGDFEDVDFELTTADRMCTTTLCLQNK